MDPLRVHLENPRYFADRSSQAVYLAGAHDSWEWQDFAWGDTLREETFQWTRNNVNGVKGDLNGDGQGSGLQTRLGKQHPITRRQRQFVRKVINTVNDLDNVLCEIANERHSESIEWQNRMVQFIHQHEQSKPKQHPVGITVPYGGTRKALGHTRRYAQRLNLASSIPSPELAASKHCLADPGQSSLVYLPAGGPVTVDLSAIPAKFDVEWFNPGTAQTVVAAPVPGGTEIHLKPPFLGAAVLFLVRSPDSHPKATP